MIVIFFTKKFSCRWILFLYKEKNNFWNFFPIDIFEKDYIGMQFETLHSWFTSFNEIINEENKKEKYEISMKICDLFLKKNEYAMKHPIKTITDWLKQKNKNYIDINKWFIDFYKKICDKEFLKKLKTKKTNNIAKKMK